jgi:hypothetical protein
MQVSWNPGQRAGVFIAGVCMASQMLGKGSLGGRNAGRASARESKETIICIGCKKELDRTNCKTPSKAT